MWRWSLLIVSILLLAGVAAGQTVDIQPGTLASLNDADVYLSLFQSERTYLAVYPGTVQIGDQNVTVDSPSRVRMTLTRLQNEVPEGEDIINFTANASGTPETRFTFTNLQAGTYDVNKDGSSLTEVETGPGGTLSFNHSAWSGDHRFEVIRAQPDRLSIATDRIDLTLGQQEVTTVTVYNARDDPETVELSVSSTLGGGSVYPRIVTEGERGESVTFDLGAGSQRTVELVVEAASCSGSCTGSVDIELTSQTTGQSTFDAITVTVQRDDEVQGSPGITLLQVLVIAVLGGLVATRRHG